MGFSYDIRSAFVHGDEPDRSLLKKLKNKRYDMDSLLILILDYLRISIALCLILGSDKKDFISQVDNSLIDETHLVRLKEKLFSIKNLICIESLS